MCALFICKERTFHEKNILTSAPGVAHREHIFYRGTSIAAWPNPRGQLGSHAARPQRQPLAELPEYLVDKQQRFADLQQQLITAKEQMTAPFPQEVELAEKSARLAEVNAELNIDRRESEVLDCDKPDEGDSLTAPVRKKSVMAR